jgi:23S rRNA (uracil1939-C5)-methyltransferase/tRNA (uracil-5-)-methyltransferase
MSDSAPPHPEQGLRKVPKKFNPKPFAYHQEIEVEIETLTNLGDGLGRVDGWVVMVPNALPQERVAARVWHNAANFSRADFVRLLRASPDRVEPRCPLFGECGGCQWQNLAYPAQLLWKTRIIQDQMKRLGGVEFPVNPCHPSPKEYNYRTKITPHFELPRRPAVPPAASPPPAAPPPPATPPPPAAPPPPATPPPPAVIASAVFSVHGKVPPHATASFTAPNHHQETALASENQLTNVTVQLSHSVSPPAAPLPIGFLAATQRKIVDVPTCPIATDAINAALPAIRAKTRAAAPRYKRGATLLIRDTADGIATDPHATVTEHVAGLHLRFPAGEFFQNNPSILPAFTRHAVERAAGSGECRHLLDAYCGSGLFALTAAREFATVHGVEINPGSVRNAAEHAAANGLENCRFTAANAEALFAEADTPPAETAVIMDPPRRGADEVFLRQLVQFAPRRIVYVSCGPDTQMRDLRHLLAAGYVLEDAQPFDLFPQTRHVENVLTLRKPTP